ncbi:triose-phosphate isomerase [soil metagenome]
MYKTVGESVETAVALKPLVANANHCEVIIAPVFTSLKTVADRLEGSNVRVSGQNCSAEVEEGAHTGEVAAFMLRDAGASHVIVGHSERRQFNSETDAMVSRKCQAGISAGLTVIMCVGETLDQREQGIAENIISGQLNGGLSGLTALDLDRIIIAYEPVWAIGTERTATPEQAQEMHAFIRRVLAEGHPSRPADALRILYGGSVKPENIADLMAQSDIDGALVGGASLKAESFARIVNYQGSR